MIFPKTSLPPDIHLFRECNNKIEKRGWGGSKEDKKGWWKKKTPGIHLEKETPPPPKA